MHCDSSLKRELFLLNIYIPQGSENDDIGQWNTNYFQNECQNTQDCDEEIKSVPIGGKILSWAHAQKFDAGLHCIDCKAKCSEKDCE